MNKISRKQKIRMFLYEYYFGHNFLIRLIRLFGGPLIFFFGIILYNLEADKSSIAYSGFCLLYGLYYTLKPFFWIMLRWNQYETDNVIIQMDDENINIVSGKMKSEIAFDLFKKIKERPMYFSFYLDTNQKMNLPKSILTVDQLKIIKSKSNPGKI